jgi:FAD/FMN-containing dehydrogenase
MVDRRDDHVGVPEEAAVQEFVASFRGELIRPEDDGYDTIRAVYNGRQATVLIVRPTGAADVIDAVPLAREHSLPLAVRCEGHSVAGNTMVDAEY